MFIQPVLKKNAHVQEKNRMDQIGDMICNFNPFLITLFTEVQYWEKLHNDKFEVPHFVLRICQQRSALRVVREKVMEVVRAYNELMRDITIDERRLFVDHLRQLDRVIYHGLTKLLWISKPKVIERFVQVS